MTEAEWLASSDLTAMLNELIDRGTSERKLRLLACACCRLIWPLLADARSREAVVVAERYADGQATNVELARARAHALAAGGMASWAAYWTANVKAAGPICNTFLAASSAPARRAAQEAVTNQAGAWDTMLAVSIRDQVALVHEVAGNPYREYTIDPVWLAWCGGVVRQLAEGIYEDRAWDRMPVLGDALEEAGCTDDEVLRHCRADAGHVRGCWVVDLILGKW